MTVPRISSRLGTLGCRVMPPLAVPAPTVAAACTSSGMAYPSGGSSGGTAARLVAARPPARGDLASLTWALCVHLVSGDYLEGSLHPATGENPWYAVKGVRNEQVVLTGGSAPSFLSITVLGDE